MKPETITLCVSLVFLILVALMIKSIRLHPMTIEHMDSLILPVNEMVKDENGEYQPVKHVLGKEKEQKYYKVALDDSDLQNKVPNIIKDTGKLLKHISTQLPSS